MTFENESNPYDGLDWPDVLDTLQANKCVLFLGSSIFQSPGGGDIQESLETWLDVKNPEHPYIQVHSPDGFFLFKKNRYRRKVVASMKEFYNQAFPESEKLFSKLARIPFSIIVTLTPDNILARTFEKLGYDYYTDFYFRNRKAAQTYQSPSPEKTLIYNLLGNIEEPESIIMTHGDFFDFLQSVFKGNSMNQELRDELENMERYIFLGLPYEKWYFQLLLRVLSLHSEKLKEIERLALKEFENYNLHSLYTNEFKIDFYPAGKSDFIEELYDRCEKKGLLKPLPLQSVWSEDIPDLGIEDLKNMVARAETREVFNYFKVILSRRRPTTQSLYNELIVLLNRFNILNQRTMLGTIDSRDEVVENNQIVMQLLQLIEKSNLK